MTPGARQPAARASVARWSRISAGALVTTALLTVVAMPSTAAARLAAPPVHLLPGLERARSSDAAGVGALTRYLPKKVARAVRSARRDAAAAAARGQRVQVTVLELAKAKLGRRIVASWRAGARRAGARPRRAPGGAGGWLVSRGAHVTVVWQSRAGVGLVQVRGRVRPARNEVALALARVADVSLSAPPPATAWERVLEHGRPDGTLSKRTALQAFSLAYGRLPGVRSHTDRGVTSTGRLPPSRFCPTSRRSPRSSGES